ncbi:alpha/beta fold hydrolase [Blattabacterium cuenoti]|uniref:alpha/beta fold hydrolase n=1 Tax=Blattabacterium cuenoti TaxID=1653831 RepID=UPI00163CB880|nr:alpha/beta fold hydrolase [Blattabacterium cuenoti]
MKILHSKIMGIGPPILVLHGLFGNGDNWISITKIIKNYQIHLLDIRNHGYSFFSKKMNLDILSKDLLKYIMYYKLCKPILLGHSIGGRIVMNFSIKYPHIPRKIIIVDISPKSYIKNDQRHLISILKKINFNIIRTRKELDSFLKKKISDINIRLFFSKCTGKNKNGKFYFRFYLPGIEKNYASLIHQNIENGCYDGPSLFLRGEYSNYIFDRDWIHIKKIFPKAEILTIPKSKHWIHIENPKDFYKKINIFLQKN